MFRGRSRVHIIAFALSALPFFAHAQVVISEIMYDAPGVDDGQEWIELYNGGENTIAIAKWKVNDGSNHVLNVPPKNGGQGATTLSAGEYAILAGDAAAFLAAHAGFAGTVVDTVLDLGNTSDAVTLLDDAGETVDTALYTKNLGAAGDGNSLQRVSGSFVAGAPTPGAPNAAAGTAPPEDDTPAPSAPGAQAPPQNLGVVSSAVAPREPQLFADAGAPRVAMAGADVLFEGRARDKKGEALTPGRFLWTFGDGATAEGRSVMHHFVEPGRYAVVLDIANGLDAASDRVVVTVIPPAVTLSARAGSIVLTNTSGTDLDLSFWSLRSGGRFFTFPKHTIILARAAVPFSDAVTRLAAATDTALLYPNGIVAKALEEGEPPPADSLDPKPFPSVAPAQPAAWHAHTTEMELMEPVPDEGAPEAAAAASTTPQAAALGILPPGSSVWFFAVLALVGAAGAGAVAARRLRSGEWEVIDETPEDA